MTAISTRQLHLNISWELPLKHILPSPQVNILPQVWVPREATVMGLLKACMQSSRTEQLSVNGVRGYQYKTADGRDFWSVQTWLWFEPALWISSLSTNQHLSDQRALLYLFPELCLHIDPSSHTHVKLTTGSAGRVFTWIKLVLQDICW